MSGYESDDNVHPNYATIEEILRTLEKSQPLFSDDTATSKPVCVGVQPRAACEHTCDDRECGVKSEYCDCDSEEFLSCQENRSDSDSDDSEEVICTNCLPACAGEELLGPLGASTMAISPCGDCLASDDEARGDFVKAVSVCDEIAKELNGCLLYTSPSPRDLSTSRMPSSA